jgi:SAM-dependent methyltransferase
LNDQFPFEDGIFDYAFCIEGPEHAENLYHIFREFYRVLKPNCHLILSIPNYSNIECRFKQFWYGVLEPINTKEDFERLEGRKVCCHVNRPPYALLRMALEAAKFSIVETTFDQEKKSQKYLYPLYLLIKLVTFIKGEKGDKKYWHRSANQKNVLMGGNTLILVCQKLA